MAMAITIPQWATLVAALTDDLAERRDAALWWFKDQRQAPPGEDLFAPARSIAAAFERFGSNAFTHSKALGEIAWDAAALDWCVARAETLRTPAPNLRCPLGEVVRGLPARQLRSHGEALRAACERVGRLEDFPEDAFQAARAQAELLPDELWAHALRSCAEGNLKKEWSDPYLEVTADLLAEAAGNAFAEPALALLRDPATCGWWEESWAIYYLCSAGVAAAAEPIVARLLDRHPDAEAPFEAVGRHLSMLPVEAVVAAYRGQDQELLIERMANFQFAKIRHPELVGRSLEIAMGLEFCCEKCFFLCAALKSLAPEAIAPSVEFLRQLPDVWGEQSEVVEELALAAAFHGLEVPKLAGWLAQLSKRRKKLAKDSGNLQGMAGVLKSWEALMDAPPPPPFDPPTEPSPKPAAAREYLPLPPIPPVLAGRNDPCPCGSGKKYKKCCVGKPVDA